MLLNIRLENDRDNVKFSIRYELDRFFLFPIQDFPSRLRTILRVQNRSLETNQIDVSSMFFSLLHRAAHQPISELPVFGLKFRTFIHVLIFEIFKQARSPLFPNFQSLQECPTEIQTVFKFFLNDNSMFFLSQNYTFSQNLHVSKSNWNGIVGQLFEFTCLPTSKTTVLHGVIVAHIWWKSSVFFTLPLPKRKTIASVRIFLNSVQLQKFLNEFGFQYIDIFEINDSYIEKKVGSYLI